MNFNILLLITVTILYRSRNDFLLQAEFESYYFQNPPFPRIAQHKETLIGKKSIVPCSYHTILKRVYHMITIQSHQRLATFSEIKCLLALTSTKALFPLIGSSCVCNNQLHKLLVEL